MAPAPSSSPGPHLDADETDVAAFLSRLAAAEPGTDSAGMIETHAARVFLAGKTAYKVKKHVVLPFLDFSRLDRRRRVLERELELNRTHAPEIYVEVVPISRRPDGTLAFGRDGAPIDYALKMNRFEQSAVLGKIAEQGPLPRPLCRALADMVAAYHSSLPALDDAQAVEEFRRTVAQLADELAQAENVIEPGEVRAFAERLLQEAEARHVLMAERARQGAIRRCHGDLHLGNIVRLEHRIVPFDALEFDERLAVIDVLYDLAFLLMDLESRGDRTAANIVLNRYAATAPVGNEIEGLALLPLFLATRATVRTVVAIERARQLPRGARAAVVGDAGSYLRHADAYLRPQRPALIAIGGLSGTGKSTLGASLAPLIGPAPGALHLRSDVERKRLFSVSEEQRLAPDFYTEAISARVYAVLLEKAERCLAAGHAVIVDAVSARPAERRAIAALAEKLGCTFAGLWLEAPTGTLVERVEARRGDASDADAAVVRSQSRYDVGSLDWPIVDSSGSPDETVARARSALVRLGIVMPGDILGAGER